MMSGQNFPAESFIHPAECIDKLLRETTEHYAIVFLFQKQQYPLDRLTAQQLMKAYTLQQDDLVLIDRQLARLRKEKLDARQQKEVVRLTKQVEQLHDFTTGILEYARETSAENSDPCKTDVPMLAGVNGGKGKTRLVN